MAKLSFIVKADRTPVTKLIQSIDELEKKVRHIQNSDLNFNKWLKAFDDLQKKVQEKKDSLEKLKSQMLSLDIAKMPHTKITLETNYAKVRKEYKELANEVGQASLKFDRAYKRMLDDLLLAEKNTDSVTSKMIEQKKVVSDLTSEIKRLNAEKKLSTSQIQKDSLAEQAEKTKVKLEEERATLNKLRESQEKAKLTVKGLKDEVRGYEKVTGKVAGTQAEANMVFDRLESSLVRLGGLAVLQKFSSDVIKATGDMQQLSVALSTILQSKSKADSLINEIKEFAVKTPFDLTEVGDATKQMLAYGSSSENVIKEMSMLGDVAAGLQIPIGQLIYLYGTLRTQGKAMTVDIRQFAGRGIPIYEELAKVLGTTTDKVGEFVTDGKVGFAEVEKAFQSMTSEGGKFYNMLENAAGTWPQQIAQIGDSLVTKLNEFGNKHKEIFELGIGTTADLVDSLDSVINIIGGLVTAYGSYKAILIATNAVQKAGAFIENIRLIGMMRKELGLATAAQQAFNTASKANVYATLISVLLGLGMAVYMFTKRTNEATEANNSLNRVSKNASEEYAKQASTIDRLNGVLKSETASLTLKKEKLKELKGIIPGYNAELDNEGKLINNNTEAIKAYLTQLEKQIKLKAAQEELEELYRKKRLQEKDIKVKEKNVEREKKNVPDVVYGGDLGIEAQRNALSRAADAESALKQANAELKITEKNIGEIQNEIEKTSISTFDNKKLETHNKSYWINQKKEAEKALESIDSKQRKLLNAGRFDKVDSKVVANYKEQKRLIAEAEKELKVYDSSSKQEDQAKEQEKLRALQEKQSKDTIRQVKDLELEATQSKINAMGEGSEKTIAQMRLDHEKEIETLKRNREDYLQKKIDAERSLFESNPKNKGKSFDSSNVFLSKDEEGMFKNMLESTITKQGNDISSYYKELLSKYQGYAEKRLAIQNKFQQERDALVKAGASKEALAENDYQRDETLQSIDNEFAMREDSFKAWADNIADLSLEKLRELLVQAEQELQRSEFLNPNDSQLAGQRAKVTSLKNTISEKAAKNNTSPDKRSKKEWQDLYNTLSKVEREFDEIGRTVGGTVGEIISAAGTITTSTLQMIDGITTLANSSSDAMAGTAQAASKSIQAVEKASVILAIVGAALQITMKMFDLFGGDDTTEKYEKTKETYESYINILDKVIDKQLELAESLYGDNANAAYEKAIELVKTQSDAARVLGKQYLNSGSSWKSHSKGYSEVDDMSWEGWNDAAKALGMSVDQFKSKMGGRMEGLFDLTDEQLEKLQAEAHIFWAQLDSDTQNYANQIAEGVGKVAEVMEQRMTDTTLIDVDTLRSDFQDLLTDMDANSADFADNFEEYMRNAILNSMLKESYMGRLEEWRKKFYAAMDDGVTEQEYNDLKEEGQQIADDMKAEREAMADMFGWKSESSSQEATAKGFQAMSQDTGDELNGRFTALQVAGEEIRNQSIKQTDLLSSINEKISLLNLTNEDIPGLTANIPDIAGQTGESITSSYQPQMQIIFPTEGLEVLADKMSSMERIVDEMRVIQIEKFTDVAEGINRMTKNAPVMNTKLDNINENIKKVL
ncbi:tape measure protein [Bacteroides sp. HPS0048]|uniref:tape measure protein n=1 Tax=Bacteroides sp. HPS0048 TaxID=1078089 RepID=UPI0035647256